MNTLTTPTLSTQNMERRKLQRYSLGFALSIITTLAAYLLTIHHIFSGWGLAYAVVSLAIIQLVVQLVFFLHIGHESEPRWNLLALDFTLLVVVILVVGSLWIMNHLNYNMTNKGMGGSGMQMNGQSPGDTNNYIIKDEGFQPK